MPDKKYFAYTSENKASNRFPCHNKVATFLSRLYFEIQREHMNSNQAEKVNAKIASFERSYAIDSSEIESVTNQIKDSLSEPTLNQLAQRLNNKVASCCEMIPMGDIVKSARELSDKGCDHGFVQKWAFGKPIVRIKQVMISIAHDMPGDDEESKSKKEAALNAAYELSTLPHKQVQERLPEFLNKVASTPQEVLRTHKKLSTVPTQEEFDVFIDGKDYPRSLVKSKLPKIAALTNLPVITNGLMLPTARWEEIISTADKRTQRAVEDCLT